MGFNGISAMCLDVYGQGQSGDLTIAAGTTAVLSADMYYRNLVVDGSLLTANYNLMCLSLSGIGVIDNSGADAIGITGGVSGSTGTWPAGAAGQNGEVTSA